MNILYNDKYIVVATKPSGSVSEIGCPDSFPDRLSAYLNELNEQSKLFPVHRLDKDTEGIMVYAKSSYTASVLSEQILNKKWTKIYTALLCGIPEQEKDTLCDLLFYDRTKGKSFVVKRERQGVRSASLTYKIIKLLNDGKRCAVSVELHTGRTHQIRVQFASRKLPLCGDRKYGAPAEYGNTLALAATSLSIPHPKTGCMLHFEITPSNFSTD